MAQLLVRNLDEDLIRALKVRAVRNGRSSEAEHRAILAEALCSEASGPSFKAFLLSMPDVGDDLDFDAPRDMPREVEL